MTVTLTERRDIELHIKLIVAKNNRVSNAIKKEIRKVAMAAYDLGVEMAKNGSVEVDVEG